jgi:hypothetical protein
MDEALLKQPSVDVPVHGCVVVGAPPACLRCAYKGQRLFPGTVGVGAVAYERTPPVSAGMRAWRADALRRHCRPSLVVGLTFRFSTAHSQNLASVEHLLIQRLCENLVIIVGMTLAIDMLTAPTLLSKEIPGHA